VRTFRVGVAARIRNAILGAVSATALVGATLAVAAAPASAATTPRYGCYGYGCIGKYPQPRNCSSDATTVWAITVYDGLRKSGQDQGPGLHRSACPARLEQAALHARYRPLGTNHGPF
jgi:hypothetical protein